MAGIKDVAKLAGVSTSTVSRVLNQTKYVSPEITRKVQIAAESLSYKADPIARNLKSKKTMTIGILTAEITGLFYPYIIESIYKVANEKKYQTIICDSQGGNYGEAGALDREFDKFQHMIRNRVDGIIFVSVVAREREQRYLEKLKELASNGKKIPIVSLERDFSQWGFEKDMQMRAEDPETQKWWDLLNPMQEPFEDREEGEWWSKMEEVYHLD